ncbi:MAG: hypothetical protein AAFY34_01330 [Pseudomonadota bacterium]
MMAQVESPEAGHMLRSFQAEDVRKAISAFMEKRPPVFQGR